VIDRVAINAAWNRICHMLDAAHCERKADALLRFRAIEQSGIKRVLAPNYFDWQNRAWGGRGARLAAAQSMNDRPVSGSGLNSLNVHNWVSSAAEQGGCLRRIR
jgi:hypothetical protein